MSGWPVTSPAGEERPGSSAVRSALPSAAWGWGVGSQLRLTVQLLGASKTPHPAPGPGTPPHQGGEGPLPPEMFSEFPDGSRVGQLGKPTIRAFLDPACRSPSPDPEGEQGSQPAENPAQARAKQAVPASGRLGSPSPSQGGSPTPQTGRQALRVSCHLPLSCRCLRPVSRKPRAPTPVLKPRLHPVRWAPPLRARPRPGLRFPAFKLLTCLPYPPPSSLSPQESPQVPTSDRCPLFPIGRL